MIEPVSPRASDKQALLVAQPLHGYFAAKTSAGWQTLSIDNPGEVR